MKIITNEKLIRRNKTIGQVTTISSLIILGGGMYLSFQNEPTAANTLISFVALILGFSLSQVGMFFGNRWGRSPRPDELINAALKGLDDHYSIYHYKSPVFHLLNGPTGLWVIIPYSLGGKILYEKGKWQQKGGSFFMKVFGQEGIGRPEIEASTATNSINRRLQREFEDGSCPTPQIALVFTDEKAVIEADNAPLPTIPAKKLKELIRKTGKEHTLRPDQIDRINNLFA